MNIWGNAEHDESLPFWFGITRADMEAAASEADRAITSQLTSTGPWDIVHGNCTTLSLPSGDRQMGALHCGNEGGECGCDHEV